MTERRSASPEAVVPETGPGVDAWAARRTSEGKPRREPYRPSSSSTAAPAATTTAPSRPSTHATHLDVAAPLNALGAAPLPPLPSSTGEEAAARRSGVHSRVNSLAAAAPTTLTTAGDSSLHGSASGVPAHTSGPIAEKAALARSSLPDSLIQQIRSTPYSSSLASRPAAAAAATHHRRTLSSLSGAAAPASAEAAEGVAATSAVPVRRAPSPVVALSSPLREKYAAPFALTPDDGHHTHQSSRRPTSFHASVLSINSASEAPLSWSPPAAATVKMSVHEMLAPLPPSSGSKHATIAHIMQRERVRTLLSRCLLRWSLFRSANTPPAARRGRAAVLTSPLPPWRPIAGGNFRSASSADEREAGGHNDDDDLVDVADATAATAAAAPPRPSTPVAREVGKAAAGSASRPSTLASRHAQPNGTVMSPLRVTTPQLLASASTSRGTTNGESCGNISHSGSSAPHHPQQQQLPAATQGKGGDGGARRRTPRERSPTTDASPFAASLPRSSSQQDLPPLHMTGLPATLPVTAAAATTAAASPRSISPSVGGATTAYVPPSITSAAGQTNSTSTSSNAATTPRQQVGEARRKSVVSQYLAGKPLGNLSPQQSTTNLFSGGAASTGGVVEVHTLSLPGSAAASSPAAHSRTQSGMGGGGGGGGSVPRRRSDGLRGSSITATTVAGALNVAGGLCSDSEEQSTSSLYFTPRSRQSNGLGGLGMPCDDDPCLSNSSMSLAAAAPLGNGGGGGGQGLGAAMAQSIPQLLVMEAEERAAVQASEQRRRTRKQRETLAHMDQLMMAALHHRSGERGLHPSLRPSAAPSPMATSRCSSGSGDEGERDSVNHSCSTSDYVVLTEGGLAGRRSAQRSPGWASTRSSVSAGIPTPTAGAAAAVLTAATPRQQPAAVAGTAPASHPVRPHLSAPVVTALSSVSRRLSHTHRGGAEEGEGGKDSAESLSDVSGDDADPAGIAGNSASRGGDREGEGSRVRYHHRHRHPLRSEASRGERCPGAVEDDDDDDEADTATAQSECTVHGLATTRQWVSQQTPETAAAAAAAALTAASESPETSSTSLSLSQPPVQTSASAKRKGSG